MRPRPSKRPWLKRQGDNTSLPWHLSPQGYANKNTTNIDNKSLWTWKAFILKSEHSWVMCKSQLYTIVFQHSLILLHHELILVQNKKEPQQSGPPYDRIIMSDIQLPQANDGWDWRHRTEHRPTEAFPRWLLPSESRSFSLDSRTRLAGWMQLEMSIHYICFQGKNAKYSYITIKRKRSDFVCIQTFLIKLSFLPFVVIISLALVYGSSRPNEWTLTGKCWSILWNSYL